MNANMKHATMMALGMLSLAALASVPEGYRQTDYLEATGTQYIRLGRNLKANTRLVSDVELTDTANGARIDEGGGWGFFGVATSSTSFMHSFRKSDGVVKTIVGAGWTAQSATLPTNRSRYVLDMKSGSQKLDGVEFATQTLPTSPSAHELTLFALHENDNYHYKQKIRLYGCKLYEGEELVMDLVPYENGTSGIMYDKVSGVSFANAGTGEFVFPPRGLIRKVDYIETDGTQHVNTGLNLSTNLRVVCSFGATPSMLRSGTVANGWSGSACAPASSTAILGWKFECNAADLTIKTCAANGWTVSKKVFPRAADAHTADIRNGHQLVDGEEIGTSTFDKPEREVSFVLFKLAQYDDRNGYQTLYPQTVRFYGCKIYSGDTLIRDFVPAISNGVVGICDRYHGNKFYLSYVGNPFKYTTKGLCMSVR